MKKYGALIPFVRWITLKHSKEKSDYGILARWIADHDKFSHVDTKEVFVERMKKSGCSIRFSSSTKLDNNYCDSFIVDSENWFLSKPDSFSYSR